ncbi:hypothetical protein IT571_00985 [Candidatus Sumerlaeota bacterium]|nr:hypothetical protein [Candidatus Sumerlaeota bacterium]
MTTPIAYLSSNTAFKDVFKIRRADIQNTPGLTGRDHYNFGNWNMRSRVQNAPFAASKDNCGMWFMSSAGPDKYTSNKSIPPSPVADYNVVSSIPYRVSYDPTNGTISVGDICRSQKYGDGILQMAPVP